MPTAERAASPRGLICARGSASTSRSRSISRRLSPPVSLKKAAVPASAQSSTTASSLVSGSPRPSAHRRPASPLGHEGARSKGPASPPAPAVCPAPRAALAQPMVLPSATTAAGPPSQVCPGHPRLRAGVPETQAWLWSLTPHSLTAPHPNSQMPETPRLSPGPPRGSCSVQSLVSGSSLMEPRHLYFCKSQTHCFSSFSNGLLGEGRGRGKLGGWD